LKDQSLQKEGIHMNITVRFAKPEEAKELAKIEAVCFPPAEAASEEAICQRMAAFPENFLVAEKDGVLAGFINGGTTDKPYLPDEFYHNTGLHLPDGAYQTVFGLNVLPQYRRQGIAEQLVKRFLQLARDRGKKAVILTCKEHMVHYYQKFGFVKYGVSDSCHGGAVWYDMRCVFSAPKIGLVLEGGGMRGIYTAGVLDVFMENGIEFDGVIGVSAGAIHGCSYVAGQHGRSIRYYKKYCNDSRFMSYESLLRTGNVVGKKFCYEDLPQRLDPFDYEAYKKSKTDFYAVCSNLETGKPEYFKIKDMRREIDVMRASSSLPYVSRIVHYKGMKLLDGGCTDSIPVKAFRKMGYRKNVVVLTRPAGYLKKPEKRGLARVFYHRYPLFCKAVENRYRDYNHTLAQIRQLERRGSVFVIRPSVDLKMGRMEHDPQEIQRVYEIGRRDAERCMKRLEQWLLNSRR